ESSGAAECSMESISATSVFEIPELLELIAQYLVPDDIARTRATCSNLSRLLEPYMWRDLVIKKIIPLQEPFLENRHLIRTLHIQEHKELDLDFLMTGLAPIEPAITNGSPSHASSLEHPIEPGGTDPKKKNTGAFINLRCFTILSAEEENDASPSSLLQSGTFFDYCPNLTNLHLPISALLDNTQLQNLDLLSKTLIHLDKLTLDGYSLPLGKTQQLLTTCFQHSQLKELTCNFAITCNSDSQQAQFNWILENLRGIPSSKITSLELPSCEQGYPSTFLIPLLKDHIPNLERFDVPRIACYDYDELDDEIRGCCPKLQHLSSSLFGRDAYDEYGVIAFFIASAGGVGIKSYHGEFFDELSYFLEPRDIMDTLLKHHSSTLEEINLPYCEVVKSKDIQSMLELCRKLKRFWATPCGCGQVAIDFRDILSGDWVCHDLKELFLTLSRRGVDDSDFDDTEDENYEGGEDDDYDKDDGNDKELKGKNNKRGAHMAATLKSVPKRVYAKIGQLVNLETLGLGCDNSEHAVAREEVFRKDLTLEDGWLAELKGLVRLRHFYMATDFWSNMGQGEVEFMHSNWLCLEKITFGYKANWTGTALDQQPHWAWLREQRPYLRFEYED
ncbi:hypothetical protein BGX26_004127, partial [Mortierella sp. AD094]